MNNPTDKRADLREPTTRAISFQASLIQPGVMKNITGKGESVNLSSGGVGIKTTYPFKKGDVVKLFIPVTEGTAQLPVYSEVMWSSAEAGEYRAGLRFLI